MKTNSRKPKRPAEAKTSRTAQRKGDYVQRRRPYADYELETIRDIRKLGTRLNKLTKDQLRELYREWSQESACAGWLAPNERSLKCFVKWATIAPCDRSPNAEPSEAADK